MLECFCFPPTKATIFNDYSAGKWRGDDLISAHTDYLDIESMDP